MRFGHLINTLMRFSSTFAKKNQRIGRARLHPFHPRAFGRALSTVTARDGLCSYFGQLA
jgi:hypothetical protein